MSHDPMQHLEAPVAVTGPTRCVGTPNTHNSDVGVGLEIDVVEAEPSLGEPTEQTDVPSMPIPSGTTPYVSHRGPTAENVRAVMAR